MLLHYSDISSVRVITENGNEMVEKKSSTNSQSMNSLEREFKAITELQSRGLDFGLVPNQSSDFSMNERSIRFYRKGTHDLSDVGHDLLIGEFFEILVNLAIQISEIHNNGYVHRDIKPGNIMISQKSSGKAFAGIVDFGMTLKINRKQDEEGVAGGTPHFSHNSQFKKSERASPGQDWYGFSLTALFLLRGSVTSMQAEIDSSPNGVTVNLANFVANTQLENFTNYLQQMVKISTSASSNLSELEHCAKNLVLSASIITKKSYGQVKSRTNSIPVSGSVVTKHDVLLIIDETNSLSKDIDKIKDTIYEVVQEFDGRMDLRIDLWTVRDYARKGAVQGQHETVRKVGYRLTARTLAHAIDEIAADATQHDEAEAYEMGFEWATGNNSRSVRRPSFWMTRENSTRTVILAGDAYAHGWLRKNWWAEFYRDCNGDELLNNKKLTFMNRHPNGLGQNDSERQELERRRTEEKNKTDQYGSREETVPDGMGGKQYRPNLRKVTERLTHKKKCTIHTISLADDTVSKSYMKFVALLGNGVTIDGRNDFVDALIGIIASPDKALYDQLLNRQSLSNSTKENLSPLTTFSLDGN